MNQQSHSRVLELMVALEKKLTKYTNDKSDGLETELQAKIEDIRTQSGEDLNNKFKKLLEGMIDLEKRVAQRQDLIVTDFKKEF